MRLVQFFIFNFFMSFLIASSHLFSDLPSGRVNIGECCHLLEYVLFEVVDGELFF